MAAVISFSAVLAFAVALPPFASGQSLNNVLSGLGIGEQSAPAPSPTGGTPSTGYQPPLHGDNPHGQGTVGVVDFAPSTDAPLSDDPAGGDPPEGEEIVLGRARGEQTASGQYRGRITVLALFGQEIVGVETQEGETEAGPLDPLQEALLDQICAQSGGQLCIEVLRADSQTTSDGSSNSFAVLDATVGGEEGITAEAASSNGSIQDDGTCQQAHGDSNVADANLGGDALQADVLQSSSDSEDCNTGTSSQENSSTTIGINDSVIPLPPGCETGTADTEATQLSPLLEAVCHADDSSGAGEPIQQAGAPYGVREALSLFVLVMDDTALTKVTGAAAESRAEAPPAGPPVTPPAGPGPQGPPSVPSGQDGGPDGAGPSGPGGPDGGPTGAEARPGDGDLAFTGVDALLLALMGVGLLAAGLAVAGLSQARKGA